MKKYFILFILILTVSFSFILAAPNYSFAQTSIINNLNPKYEKGEYELNDVLTLATTAAQLILGVIGSLTLLMFVYGGFLFLTSAGSNEKISEAKKTIMAAVIGLIIVFSSYLIIRFILTSLGLSWSGQEVKKASFIPPISRLV